MPEDKNFKPILESLLFISGSPQPVKKLAKILKISPEKTRQILDSLAEDYKTGSRGLRLLQKDDEIQLATAPEHAPWISEMAKMDFEEDLSRSSLETLAIVAYRSPVSRSGIEAVRGVDSTYTLRTLMLRGLVERYENPADQRSYLYRPTFDFLKHLGIEKMEDLPDFRELSKKLSPCGRSPVGGEKTETDSATSYSSLAT